MPHKSIPEPGDGVNVISYTTLRDTTRLELKKFERLADLVC